MEFYFSDANLHKSKFLGELLEQSLDGCKFGDYFIPVHLGLQSFAAQLQRSMNFNCTNQFQVIQ